MRIPLPTSRKKARIEIIPLIDVVFFLLATFVMVSLSMVRNQGISVNLPIASTGAPQEKKRFVTVTVTKEGSLYLDKKLMSQADLVGRLKDLKTSDPEIRVLINGDEEAPLGNAIHVLDEIRNLGITKVAIQTKSHE